LNETCLLTHERDAEDTRHLAPYTGKLRGIPLLRQIPRRSASGSEMAHLVSFTGIVTFKLERRCGGAVGSLYGRDRLPVPLARAIPRVSAASLHSRRTLPRIATRGVAPRKSERKRSGLQRSSSGSAHGSASDSRFLRGLSAPATWIAPPASVREDRQRQFLGRSLRLRKIAFPVPDRRSTAACGAAVGSRSLSRSRASLRRRGFIAIRTRMMN
jgi:hypothetical protein